MNASHGSDFTISQGTKPAPADHQTPADCLTLQADPAVSMLGEVPE